jgi:hypothetical protein
MDLDKFPSTVSIDDYLDLIANGRNEIEAAGILGVDKKLVMFLLVRDPEFKEKVFEAKKRRADHWVNCIIRTVDEYCEPKDVPLEKLKFEKFKYLATVDNPEKYGRTSSSEVNVNVFDIKGITSADALKAIRNDPFAIEVEAVEVEDGKTEGVEEQGEDPNPEDCL